MPMLVAGPGVERGKTSDALVGLHDLCPTILDLTNSETIDVPDSCSFVEVLEGGEGQRKGAYSESHGTRFPLAQRIWWQGDYKFVFNGFDFDELYDLANDPSEMRNLIDKPEQQERAQNMMKEVWREIRETGDRTLEETHYFSMRMGIIGPNS